MLRSKLSFDETITIEHSHGIHADHALYAVLALLRLVGRLLGPDKREAGIESRVPGIALRDDHAGALALHDQAVDQVLEGLLRRHQLLHYDLVYLAYPRRHLPLLVGLWTQVGLDRLEDYLFDVLVWK